jgi:hypothetical protein
MAGPQHSRPALEQTMLTVAYPRRRVMDQHRIAGFDVDAAQVNVRVQRFRRLREVDRARHVN